MAVALDDNASIGYNIATVQSVLSVHRDVFYRTLVDSCIGYQVSSLFSLILVIRDQLVSTQSEMDYPRGDLGKSNV